MLSTNLNNCDLGTAELNYLGIISRDAFKYLVERHARSTYSFRVVRQSLDVDGIVKNLINSEVCEIIQYLPSKDCRYEDLVVLALTKLGWEIVETLNSFEEL